MDDYCVNCKLFRNLNNKLDKIEITKLSAHVIAKGYEYDTVLQRDDVEVYSNMQAYCCDYCKSISFKEEE